MILSMHQDESYVLQSLKAGAKGYLLKDSLREDVIERSVPSPRAVRFSRAKSAGCCRKTTCDQLDDGVSTTAMTC